MQKRRMHEKSELLSLLHNREKDIAKMPDPYKVPAWAVEMSAKTLQVLQEAVRCTQEVHSSDPWAGKRAELAMFRGIDVPSDVLAACAKLRGLRRKQSEVLAENAALKTVQRKMDEDRAWNQFHSKQYQEEKDAA